MELRTLPKDLFQDLIWVKFWQSFVNSVANGLLSERQSRGIGKGPSFVMCSGHWGTSWE
jgi:hypothetical protein